MYKTKTFSYEGYAVSVTSNSQRKTSLQHTSKLPRCDRMILGFKHQLVGGVDRLPITKPETRPDLIPTLGQQDVNINVTLVIDIISKFGRQ